VIPDDEPLARERIRTLRCLSRSGSVASPDGNEALAKVRELHLLSSSSTCSPEGRRFSVWRSSLPATRLSRHCYESLPLALSSHAVITCSSRSRRARFSGRSATSSRNWGTPRNGSRRSPSAAGIDPRREAHQERVAIRPAGGVFRPAFRHRVVGVFGNYVKIMRGPGAPPARNAQDFESDSTKTASAGANRSAIVNVDFIQRLSPFHGSIWRSSPRRNEADVGRTTASGCGRYPVARPLVPRPVRFRSWLPLFLPGDLRVELAMNSFI